MKYCDVVTRRRNERGENLSPRSTFRCFSWTREFALQFLSLINSYNLCMIDNIRGGDGEVSETSNSFVRRLKALKIDTGVFRPEERERDRESV